LDEPSSGSPAVMAAIVLGISIVGSSFLLTSSIDRASVQVSQAVANLKAVKGADGALQAAAASGRPQQGKIYEVDIGDAPAKGPKTAKVTIVEFSDFQCPYCSRVGPTLAQIQKEYPKNVRIVFKHMPLSFHEQAPAAHQAAEAARIQGKFWEMHDKIFSAQRDLTPATFERYAKEIGLDVAQYKRDVNSPAVRNRLKSDSAQATKLGVTGTPSFFINGRFLSGAQPYASFKSAIDEALEKS
jgi:protein-disulfide isomerase